MPLQQAQPIVTTENRTHTVVEKLNELILSGALKAGSTLPAERELAVRLGVSRNVLREATKILQSRGLLQIRHGHKTRVAGVSSEPVQRAVSGALYGQDDALLQLTEARLVMEVGIAGLAAQRANDDDIQALREALQQLRAAVHDAQLYAEYDVTFHRALAQATHNAIFPLMLDSIEPMLRQSREAALENETPAASLEEHARILGAIETHDASAAENAMRAHLELQKSSFKKHGKKETTLVDRKFQILV